MSMEEFGLITSIGASIYIINYELIYWILSAWEI